MAEKVSNPFSVSNHQPLRFLGDEFLELETFIHKLSTNYIELMFGHESNQNFIFYKEYGSKTAKQYYLEMIKQWAEARQYFRENGKLPEIQPKKTTPIQGDYYK